MKVEEEIEKKKKEEFSKRLGELIRKIRTEKGMSGAELARRCFMDKPNISRLEKGKFSPTLYYLRKICKGLGITLSDLIIEFEKYDSSALAKEE